MFYYYPYLVLFVITGTDVDSFFIDCSEDNGARYHILPISGCHYYYSCRSLAVEYYKCPEGTIFNYNLNKCSTSGSCYELVCAGRRDGNYPDPTENCTRYYSCSDGLLSTVHTCPPGTIFYENRCQPESTSKCEVQHAALVTRKKDLCENSLDGYHPLAECSAYVHCLGGVEQQVFTCPPGLMFNGSICTQNVNCPNFCTNKLDGYLYDPDTDCTEYVYCKDGLEIARMKCPMGTRFNGEQCVIDTTFQCPQINKCKGVANGFYSDYSLSCKSYYACRNGQTVQKVACNQNEVWNGKKCVPDKEFHCENPKFSINCLGKLGFYPDKINCSNYYYCSFGMKTSFSCPQGTVFNGTNCVKASEYKCPNVTVNSCLDKKEGYYVDIESNCQSYYYCAQGNKLVYVCPVGKIYNGEECVQKSSYSCPYSTMDCKNLTNGYHRSLKSNNEYIFCQNEVKLSTFRCESNEIFDGEKCIDKERNVCQNIRKGYKTNENCQIYYLCKDYAIVETKKCPDNHIFNGKQCVSREKYECPRNDCINLADGFYQDFESDCHKYFYCINGYKTTLICPPGKLHNGNICVPEESYTCPNKHISSENIIYAT